MTIVLCDRCEVYGYSTAYFISIFWLHVTKAWRQKCTVIIVSARLFKRCVNRREISAQLYDRQINQSHPMDGIDILSTRAITISLYLYLSMYTGPIYIVCMWVIIYKLPHLNRFRINIVLYYYYIIACKHRCKHYYYYYYYRFKWWYHIEPRKLVRRFSCPKI